MGVLTVHAAGGVTDLPGERVAAAGKYGVQLFFILSALTLLQSMALRAGKEKYVIRNFFVRRFFRIAPLFWIAIAIYFFINESTKRFWAPNGLDLWHFFTTAFFLHGWTPSSINSVVPGGWSIAVEMTFYLCLPLLATHIKSIWASISMIFYSVLVSFFLERLLTPFIGSVIPYSEHYLIPYFFFHWFPSQLPVFLIGFLTYYVIRNDKIMAFVSKPGRGFLLTIISLFSLFGLTGVTSWFIPIHVMYAILFSGLIIALSAKPLILFVNPLLCKIGVISYSCYITHWIAVDVSANLIKIDFFSNFSPKLAALFHFSSLWVSALILTLAASIISYWLIEKPGIKVGNMLINTWEKSNFTRPMPTSKLKSRPIYKCSP